MTWCLKQEDEEARIELFFWGNIRRQKMTHVTCSRLEGASRSGFETGDRCVPIQSTGKNPFHFQFYSLLLLCVFFPEFCGRNMKYRMFHKIRLYPPPLEVAGYFFLLSFLKAKDAINRLYIRSIFIFCVCAWIAQYSRPAAGWWEYGSRIILFSNVSEKVKRAPPRGV
jgi:hypothetical protein